MKLEYRLDPHPYHLQKEHYMLCHPLVTTPAAKLLRNRQGESPVAAAKPQQILA